MFNYQRLLKRERENNEHAVATYEQQLRANPDVPAAYLKGRGLTGELAQHYRLGYIHDPLPGHEAHQGRLVIPYLTRTGVRWLKTRRLIDDSEREVPKYLWLTPGEDKRLFNTLDMFATSSILVVCEGEVDAMVMSFLVGLPAVSIPGTQFWDRRFKVIFDDYDRVLVCMDGDTAGQKASDMICSDLKGKARAVKIPDGHDVNSFFQSNGREAVLDLLGVKA